MEKYVNQLILDLKDVLKTSIPVPFVEIPPEMKDFPEVAEADQQGLKINAKHCIQRDSLDFIFKTKVFCGDSY